MPFVPTLSGGTNNLSDAVRLDLSSKDIFGRDDEIAILRRALTRVCRSSSTASNASDGRAELLLVSGASGTGKSTLVNVGLRHYMCNNPHRTFRRGFFVSAKFNQQSSYAAATTRNFPLATFSEAINELCELANERNDRTVIVEGIKKALRVEGESEAETKIEIPAFLPGLQTLLVGEGQTTVESSDSCYMFDAFASLCCTLLKIIASTEHPVVIFIDDLQRADGGTLKLVHSLFIDQAMQGLLIVGAYRNDEVDENHALRTTLNKVEMIDSRLTEISIGCLSEESVNDLVAFATELPPSETAPLSELIHRKTVGNCFFVTQFLGMLQDDGLLRFSFTSYKWNWTLEDVAAKTNVSENVVDLVMKHMGKLKPVTRDVFQIAGCIGFQFTANVIHIVRCGLGKKTSDLHTSEKQEEKALETTNSAIDRLLSINVFEQSKGFWIKFAHDRIQQAAESWLSDENERLTFCLDVGRILKNHLERGQTEEDSNSHDKEWLLFTAIDQLNEASKLISSADEKRDVAALNQRAAELATERSAFIPAASYYTAAISLLGNKLWKDDRGLAMELHNAAAKSYLKCGRNARGIEIAKTMLLHSTSKEDQITAHTIHLEALAQQGRYTEGKGLGMEMLRLLGRRFPRRPNQIHIMRGF